ncbi:MAG: discoidin domain-containing protein [Desulfobacula sp.]|uniref:discoidin domain-containing protein n=1 Tax=Desulfobacula sp. TaxID=2593537 RepID=UPI0025BBAFD5|nr:discoidin domain-containing protein [Desulfobacula sp.]MCD4720304.1 discoidin domain-containing protein [Desulfobacula sp.]
MIKQVRMIWMVIFALVLFVPGGLWAGSMQSSASDSATRSDIGDLLFENSDFEAGDLTNWIATGDAFDFQPTKGDNPTARHRKHPSEHQGEYWIGTFEKYNGKPELRPGQTQGDRPSGTLTSVPFVVSREQIVFLIGGGKYPDKEYAALVVDGKEVKKATGKSKETMHEVVWDVGEFAGKQAQIVIKDLHLGGWGHVNADYFHFLGAAFEPPPVTDVVSSELTVKGYGKYFNNAELILDGHFPKDGSLWKGEDCVWWQGTAPYFLVDLGNTFQVLDIIMQVDNNDNYRIDYSQDGTQFSPLLIIKKGYGKIGHGIDTMTTRNGHPDYVSQLDFQPVPARFLKIYALGGDNNYSISELKVITGRKGEEPEAGPIPVSVSEDKDFISRDSFFKDIPAYPESVFQGTKPCPQKWAECDQCEQRYYITNDAPEKVCDFYKAEMPVQGWKKFVYQKYPEGACFGTWVKENRKTRTVISIGRTRSDKKTFIGILKGEQCP